MLLAVAENSPALLDANVKVNTVLKKGHSLLLECPFATPEAEFLFSSNIEGVFFNGRKIKADIEAGFCKLDIGTPGVYVFELKDTDNRRLSAK